MIRWWQDLSVGKKLYAVVGLMAILIASELFTLLFAMSTLSSVRAFVAGEGLWTKAQKDSIQSLYHYALNRDEKFYQEYRSSLAINRGDHMARVELTKGKNFDYETVRAGFVDGGNHPDDVPGMIKLLTRFHDISFIHNAIVAWTRADLLLEDVRIEAEKLHHDVIDHRVNFLQVERTLRRLSKINAELTLRENEFSAALGEGSRWLEHLLMWVLALTVLTIESTGIFLTYRFSRSLTRALKELMSTAAAVGRGNFSVRATKRSGDELGQVAEAMNNMIVDLKVSVDRRKQAEEIQNKSEERYRILIDAVEDYAIFMLDPSGLISTWNSGAQKIMGYTAPEIIGRPMSVFFTPESAVAKVPENALKEAAENGRYEANTVRVRKDGTRFWADVHITAMHNSEGHLNGYSAVTRDVTARWEAEQRLQRLNAELEMRVELRTNELQERESRLRLVTDAVPVLLAQLDLNEKFLFANEAYCQRVGLPRDQVLGRTLKQVVGDKKYKAHQEVLGRVFAGESVRLERQGTKNEELSFEVTYVPEFGEGNKVVGFIMVAADITTYKVIERELKSAKETAELANATKSTFLANMSHEIRTPLAAILGFSDLLLEPGHTESEKMDSIMTIRRNSEHLSNLVNEVMDLSKIEAGHLQLEQISFPLADTLKYVEDILGFRAREKGISLNLKISDRVPKHITTDPTRLRQILINVVGNAVKFTEKGGVEVDIDVINPAEKKGRALFRFQVKDTGIGITPEQAQRLFTPFVQSDSSMTRKFGGTGLGLALSRRLAMALGGNVVLEDSGFGKGSTFVITIDAGSMAKLLASDAGQLTLATTEAPRPSVADAFKDLKILLVEDSPDNRILVQAMLKPTGAQISVAQNGLEGVEKAMDGDFDIILMDIQMPVLDGHEATKRLRQNGYATPIIALTAHALKEDRDLSLKSGFNDHLTKPLNRSALIATIARFTGETQKSAAQNEVQV